MIKGVRGVKFISAIMRARGIAAAAGLALLAACSTPPPPPPPVAKPEPIPMRPMPPQGAHAGMIIPMRGVDGIRLTVNAHITPAQTAWNLRSAYNVAALNCDEPEHASIVQGYTQFLKAHQRGLSQVNAAVEAEWRRRVGSGFQRERDTYSTRVYNYFALPPVLPGLCDAMVEISAESLLVPTAELESFSVRNLNRIESLFEQFYSDFEQYKQDLAAWDARYGILYGSAQVSDGGSGGGNAVGSSAPQSFIHHAH